MTRHARFLRASSDHELDDHSLFARDSLRQGSGLTLGCNDRTVDCD